MEQLDLKKLHKNMFSPSSKAPSIVEVPSLKFIMIDGHGDPNTAPEYAAAVQTLYGIAYTLKFHVKKTLAVDYGVSALEGLWWVPDMSTFSTARKSDWDWTMMILQPDLVTPDLFEEARRQAAAKGKAPLAGKARLETFQEGTSAQILYFGPYADEGPTIAALHQFAKDQGYALAGKHHEIYLNDPRKVAPEKMKTIIRQPVTKG